MFSEIWATASRSSTLSMCLMITAPMNNLGFRAGLPVDLGGFRLLNRFTSSSQGITELSTTQRLEGSKPF